MRLIDADELIRKTKLVENEVGLRGVFPLIVSAISLSPTVEINNYDMGVYAERERLRQIIQDEIGRIVLEMCSERCDPQSNWNFVNYKSGLKFALDQKEAK